MNKLLVAALLISVTGCSTTVPVVAKFPVAPESLMEAPVGLTPLDTDKREISDLLENVAENYGQYYILEIKYKAWQDWYQQQKRIFEEIK